MWSIMREKRRRLVVAFLLAIVFLFLWACHLTGSTRHESLQSSTPLLTDATATNCTESLWNPEDLNDVYSVPIPSCPANLVLLVLVISAPPNHRRRRAIRSTWGRSKDENWRTLFLLGREPEEDHEWLELDIEKEAEKERDIVRGNYIDSYRNLTLKVIHGFSFAYTSCPSQFILKTDDDCFVQTTGLFQFLTSLPPNRKTKVYAGRPVLDTTVIRDIRSRWFVSRAQHSSKHYVPYASGTGYLLSSDVLERIVRLFPCVRPFPNEDAFIGTVIGQWVHVPLQSSDRFTPFSGGWNPCNLLYLFVVHDVPAHLQKKYYRDARTAVFTCSVGAAIDLKWFQNASKKAHRLTESDRIG